MNVTTIRWHGSSCLTELTWKTRREGWTGTPFARPFKVAFCAHLLHFMSVWKVQRLLGAWGSVSMCLWSGSGSSIKATSETSQGVCKQVSWLARSEVGLYNDAWTQQAGHSPSECPYKQQSAHTIKGTTSQQQTQTQWTASTRHVSAVLMWAIYINPFYSNKSTKRAWFNKRRKVNILSSIKLQFSMQSTSWGPHKD